MIKPTIFTATWIAASACALSLLAIEVGAQTAPPAAAAKMLGLGEIESRLTAQGITIREIELRDVVVEVEGRDAQGRKIELLLDRRSGEILSQKPDR
jgi:peptidase YpeB-like protein